MKERRNLQRLLIVLLIVIVTVLAVGCGSSGNSGADAIQDMEIEYAPKFSYDVIGGDDVMPIMGFYGPRPNNYSYNANVLPDYYSDEIFDLLTQAGINVIGTNWTHYDTAPSYVYKLLEQCEKYHIGAIISDNMIFEEDITLEEMDARLNQYANYAAFCGVHLCDEPGTAAYRATGTGKDVDYYAGVAQKLNELGYSFYANLYGRLVGTESEPNAKTEYAAYVKEFAEALQPDYLLFDRYIFDENAGLSRAYLHFQNLEAVRYQAEQDEIPFWLFVQAGSQWNDAKQYFDSNGYFPSKGEFFWMANTGLAYGAKGVAYFPMIQPYWFAYSVSEPFDYQRNGIIGAAGNKTRWFYYAREVSAQIRAVDEVLMNAVNKGVIAAGEDARGDMSNNQYLIEEGSFRELKSVNGDAIIGCFNYLGKTALYVVNYDVEYAQEITLTLQGKCNVEITQEAQTERYSSNRIVLELGAGDGALVVFK